MHRLQVNTKAERGSVRLYGDAIHHQLLAGTIKFSYRNTRE